MFDPRDNVILGPEDALTEDSDDALADLEKEFAAKRQKLLEERERKRVAKSRRVQVERSPSPPRKRHVPNVAAARSEKEMNTEVLSLHQVQQTSISNPKMNLKPRPNGMQRVQSAFADRLYEAKIPQDDINYNERIFEFENIPSAQVKPTTDENAKDPLSGEILSRRYITCGAADKLVANVKILRVSKLLAKVVPPKYEEPHYVNWCFTGIIMHKSEPKNTIKNKKYMLLRIGSFLHTVDLMLFGDAFHRFWKVRAGDVVAVLNPTVKKIGNSFNLSLSDDLASMVEIGTLKNYAHCAATTKEGLHCKHVVDSLQNTLCSFHEEQKYKLGSRMELQGVKPKAPRTKYGMGEMHMNRNTNQTYVHYNNTGFHERDEIYSGGHQFDQSKYDRPVESHASKIRKERANAKLEAQLLHSVAPRHLDDLAQLGIINKDKVEKTQEKHTKVRKQAFNSSFITGMGFDPTMSTKKNAGCPLEQLQELRQLSQSKKISLGMSREEACKRKDKWRQAMALTKPKETRTVPLVTSRATPVILDLDSDSDIEITFT